jgi:hypothetical protein
LGRGARLGILSHVSAIRIRSENRCQRHNRNLKRKAPQIKL